MRHAHQLALLVQRLCQLVAALRRQRLVLVNRLLLGVFHALVKLRLGLLLVLLLLIHELVQRVLHVLHTPGFVRLGMEGHPQSHRTHKHVVIGVYLAQHLAAQLRLLLRGEHAAHLESAHRRLELVLRAELLVQPLLVLVQKRLVVVQNVGLGNDLLFRLLELLEVLGQLVKLDAVLVRHEAEKLQELVGGFVDVPVLHKLLEEEVLALFDDVLRRNERQARELLARNGLVLVQQVHVFGVHGAVGQLLQGHSFRWLISHSGYWCNVFNISGLILSYF